MLKVEGLLAVVSFALWVFCLVEVITTDEGRIRNLPKIPWLLIVLLFPLVGSIAWLVAGRPNDGSGRRASAYERANSAFPEYDRPGRAAALDPSKDDEFLKDVRARAEEQRARYRAEQQRRQQEQQPRDPDA